MKVGRWVFQSASLPPAAFTGVSTGWFESSAEAEAAARERIAGLGAFRPVEANLKPFTEALANRPS